MAYVLIVGGGHNALISAFYLSEAGYKVTVAEQSGRFGGACAPRRAPCGCLLYPGANHFGMLHSKIATDLSLAGVRLQTMRPSAQLMVPMPNGASIVLSDEISATLRSLAKHSVEDAEVFPQFVHDLGLATELLRQVRADPSKMVSDFIGSLAALDSKLPTLFATGSLASTLRHYFKASAVQGALASSMVLFNAGPQRKGTAFALPYYSMMCVGDRMGWEMLVGGMDTLTQALVAILEARGCTLLLNTAITALEVRDGKVSAARSAKGDPINADYFLAGCDPFVTAKLLERGGFSSPAWARLRRLWKREAFRGMCGKALYLLKRPPVIKGLSPAQQSLAAKTLISNLSSLEMMSEAYRTAQRDGMSTKPYLEILLPSEIDPTQSCGRHVTASVYYMYSRYRRRLTLEQRRGEAACIRSSLDDIYAGFSDEVEAEYILTNSDIAAEFGMSFGNVDHGSLLPEYAMGSRGLPGTQPPGTDVDNLFLASSGSTPGGLVSGIPGLIAAQAILRRA